MLVLKGYTIYFGHPNDSTSVRKKIFPEETAKSHPNIARFLKKLSAEMRKKKHERR